MTLATTTGGGPPADWAAYLDGLEAAVRTMDAALIEGHAPDDATLAALGALDVPASALPPRLADRRVLLVALLQDVTGRALARRDAVAAELLSMPHRRVPAARNGPATLGGMLDIVG
jgi:hypothetical protein